MTVLLTLASAAIGEKTWWNPYAKGALIAILAIGLFVGSAYLLLYTNVGTRLGFLLTAAAFFGFIAVLSVFWITGQFPNGPLGPAAGWPVEEANLASPSESSLPAVRNILSTGEEAPSDIVGQVRADFDAELNDADGFVDGSPAEVLTQSSYVKGGGRKWPMWWSEKTTYAVLEVCPTIEQQVLPLEPPPTPECDPAAGTQWIVFVKDLGARRLPSFFFFGAASLLFALTLYALHRYELDQRPPEETDGADAEPEAATT